MTEIDIAAVSLFCVIGLVPGMWLLIELFREWRWFRSYKLRCRYGL